MGHTEVTEPLILDSVTSGWASVFSVQHGLVYDQYPKARPIW